MSEFLAIILFSLLGLFVGGITGLVPGLHANTISLLIVSFSGQIAISLKSFMPGDMVMITLSSFLLGAAITHTFVNIIPATFLGVPDEDTALSILPAHQLLLDGKGYEAIVLSAFGSFCALLFSIVFIFPFRYILSEPLNFYAILKENMFWVLLGIIILMVATEKSKKGSRVRASIYALTVILISGIFGLIVLNLPADSPFSLPSSILFPTLAGLFGMSTQIYSLLSEPVIKEQRLEEVKIRDRKTSFVSIFTGTIAGAFVSIIPGITAATGTIIAMTTRGRTDARQTIITLSAVNTSCAFLVIIVLFVLLKARSGVADAISNLMVIEKWNTFVPPIQLVYLLIPLILAGSFAYPFTCFLGKRIAKNINRIPYKTLLKYTILILAILVFVFNGFIGLLILLVATGIGLIPIFFGVRRSNCMGVLIVPLMIHFLLIV